MTDENEKLLVQMVLHDNERMDELEGTVCNVIERLLEAGIDFGDRANTLRSHIEQLEGHHAGNAARRAALHERFGFNESFHGQLTSGEKCQLSARPEALHADNQHRSADEAGPERAKPNGERVLKKLCRKRGLLKVCALAFCRKLRSAFSEKANL